MGMRFLLDECLRDKKLWKAVGRHNRDHPAEFIEAIRVGDDGAPPQGIQDSEVVKWAATNGWTLFSNDANTLRQEHDSYAKKGNSTHGLLLRRSGFPISEIVECLILISHDSSPEEWMNRTDYIPF